MARPLLFVLAEAQPSLSLPWEHPEVACSQGYGRLDVEEGGAPMPLPIELIQSPDDTDVIGDIDAFIAYVESGQALQDWQTRVALLTKALEELF